MNNIAIFKMSASATDGNPYHDLKIKTIATILDDDIKYKTTMRKMGIGDTATIVIKNDFGNYTINIQRD